jgi:multidrug efflux pump
MTPRFNLSEWAVHHRPLVLFMLIILLLGGVFAFNRLARLEDPVFNVPTMTVVVAWPGATAQEVQDQVLNRIEREWQTIDGVDRVSSFARQGYGGINLWMNGGTPGPQLQNAWYLARKKVGDIRDQLPAGVRGPYFNDEFSDVISVMYALQAPPLSWPELHDLAEGVKRRSQSVEGVQQVAVLGRQDERIWVEFSSRRLAALGLSPPQLLQTLAQHSPIAPAGAMDGAVDRVFVRLAHPLTTVADVAALPIDIGGRTLRLDDVAEVKSGVEEPRTYTVRHQGSPALMLAYTFSKQGNILDIGQALDERMRAIAAELPVGVALHKVADQPQVVADSVWEFEKAFLEALAIVLAVCFLFLGWRTGVVVAASVPLVLAIVALVMWAAGWALDRISLGALIIALGLLVDDAIIAVEMMVVKIEQGWDRVQAATFAWTSTAFPMLTGTLVTVAGFMPVGFAQSIAGEYAGGIFWVVGLALVASWLVAVVFTPYLGVLILPRHMQVHGDPYDRPLYTRLRRWVGWCVQRWPLVLAGTAVLLGAAVAGMGAVQQQFFPTASRLELIVDLRLREGASFHATQAQVQKLEEVLKKDPQVTQFTAYTGAGAPRFFLSISADLPNPGLAQIVVQTDSIEGREAVRQRLMRLFDEGEAFPDLRGRVSRFEFGPPVGFPVQFRVVGPDAAELRRIANQVRDTVRQSPLVRDTQLDWGEQVRTLRLEMDEARARALGFTRTEVAAQLQTLLEGAPAAQLRRGEEKVDVVLRGTAHERLTLEHLGDVMVFSRSGVAVPLSQVARLVPTYEDPVLWRRNRELTLTVRSDVQDGVQGPYASQQIWPTLQPMMEALPVGYRIEMGGAIEESDKSNQALFAVFPLMLAVMLLILMVQVQSFSRLCLVFLTAPLGLIGVVPALLVFNAPFGFVALLGVIALGGMIMRNAVILVDQIDQDIASGLPVHQAVVEATVRRARPVVLTAAAAVLAMVPLSTSVFWGPMAIAIMGGLLGATALTLAFVPALYMAWLGRPPQPVAGPPLRA